MTPWEGNPWVQCTGYALELLSQGGLRDYAIGALVTDHWVQLMFYDRSIIIFSKPLDFVAEPEKFCLVLQTLAQHSKDFHGLGYIECLQPSCGLAPSEDADDIFGGQELKLKNGLVLTLGETLFRQHTIIGRGTTTIIAKVKNPVELGNVPDLSGDEHTIWEGEVVVKFSWPARSRTPEAVFVNDARRVAQQLEGGQKFLNHLPKILYTQDFEPSELSERLATSTYFGKGVYEQRQLRVTVSERLYPITNITDPEALRKAIWEIIDCM